MFKKIIFPLLVSVSFTSVAGAAAEQPSRNAAGTPTSFASRVPPEVLTFEPLEAHFFPEFPKELQDELRVGMPTGSKALEWTNAQLEQTEDSHTRALLAMHKVALLVAQKTKEHRSSHPTVPVREFNPYLDADVQAAQLLAAQNFVAVGDALEQNGDRLDLYHIALHAVRPEANRKTTPLFSQLTVSSLSPDTQGFSATLLQKMADLYDLAPELETRELSRPTTFQECLYTANLPRGTTARVAAGQCFEEAGQRELAREQYGQVVDRLNGYLERSTELPGHDAKLMYAQALLKTVILRTHTGQESEEALAARAEAKTATDNAHAALVEAPSVEDPDTLNSLRKAQYELAVQLDTSFAAVATDATHWQRALNTFDEAGALFDPHDGRDTYPGLKKERRTDLQYALQNALAERAAATGTEE